MLIPFESYLDGGSTELHSQLEDNYVKRCMPLVA